MRSKFKLPFIPTMSVVILLAAVLLWWVNPARVLAGFQLLPVSLQSPLNADYSVDPRLARLKPLDLGIIEEAIRDRQAAANVEQIIGGLTMPVPTITPLPGFNPTNPTALPTLMPTITTTTTVTLEMTNVSPTVTPTQPLSQTATTVFVVTSTLPAVTQRPTDTSIAHTNTPVPPTLTAVPPTNTPVPPTRTAPPPTRTNPYPAPPTRVPTSGPTAYP